MKKSIFLIAIATVLLLGCKKDEVTPKNSTQNVTNVPVKLLKDSVYTAPTWGEVNVRLYGTLGIEFRNYTKNYTLIENGNYASFFVEAGDEYEFRVINNCSDEYVYAYFYSL